MLDKEELLKDGYSEVAIDAANAGLAELISQEDESEAIARVARIYAIDSDAKAQIRGLRHWIDYLSALNRYHFHPTISRLQSLCNDLM